METADATPQQFFDALVRRIPGALVVTVHDVSASGGQPPAPPQEVLRATAASYLLDDEGGAGLEKLSGVFALSSDYASKLQMGKNTGTTAFYDDCTVSHLVFSSLVVTLLGTTTANVGVFSSFAEEIGAALGALVTSSDQR